MRTLGFLACLFAGVGIQPVQSPPSAAHQVEESVDQWVFHQKGLEYYLVHGIWETTTTSGVQRLRPTGTGEHVIELGVSTRDGGYNAQMLSVPAQGEVHIISSSLIIVDMKGRDNVELRSVPGYLTGGLATDPCDGVYSNVTTVAFSGGCWSTLISNPETGVWEKKCDRHNEKECKAIIHFSDGSGNKTLTFDCSPEEGEDGKMTGNNGNGSANAFNAQGNC